nr:MAG TPA: hypothetical protein [Caudoviricetes sp.]
MQCYRALANTREPQRKAPLPSAKIRQSFEIAPSFIEKVSNFRENRLSECKKQAKRENEDTKRAGTWFFLAWRGFLSSDDKLHYFARITP